MVVIHPKKTRRVRSSRRTKKVSSQREKLVTTHIHSLFSLVKLKRHSDHVLASRYMWLIRRISMKCNHPLDSEIRRSYCKHCKLLFIPGRNCRVRVQRKKIIYTCFACKKYTRIPYSKKSKN
jgi:ribonuclease P protein subunit RPR2